MEITEEERNRAETNRLAALAKRKARLESINHHQEGHQDPWKLFKCRKFSSSSKLISTTCSDTHFSGQKIDPVSINTFLDPHLPEKFRVRLEICSPDSFSVFPDVAKGFSYPGDEECFRRLSSYLSNVILTHYTQMDGDGKACVYKLMDYYPVLKCLKCSNDIEVEEIPWATFNVVERFSHSFVAGCWIPCRPEHFSEDKVDELISKLPKALLQTLLPFQLYGVRFGLRRGGRFLIADEMGLGKTLQAIAIIGCFINEGSVLVVVPAILRFAWAEELERWLPFCAPSDIHLVFGHLDNPCKLSRFPRVVVISYTMLHRLRKSMLDQKWVLMIADESHHVRCTKKSSEPDEIRTVLEISTKVKHIVLLSGTPSLSRPYDIFNQVDMLWPGLLGKTKYEFAKTYCAVKSIRSPQGNFFQDFSRGVRLEELNVLLKQTVMIRRLKEHVLVQLPPKRRQIIRLLLKRSDIIAAKAAVTKEINAEDFGSIAAKDTNQELEDLSEDTGNCGKEKLSYQELGIAKLSGFREWFAIHPLIAELDGVIDLDLKSSSQKMIIFCHHHKVLDAVQELMCEKGIGYVRIDGTTLARDRQSAVASFQSSAEVKIAIIGITAGGVGLDFSSAQNVVFLELPRSPSLMLQAEDRAHRRGQTMAVNIYIFCAKDTLDESLWQCLNRSLRRVSSTTNGKYDAIKEIVVEDVSFLERYDKSKSCDDQIVDIAPGVALSSNLMKLRDSVLVKNEDPVHVFDELVAETKDKSDVHGDSHCSSTHLDDLYIKEEDVKMEENISKVDAGNLHFIPCLRPDKGDDGKEDQAEKKFGHQNPEKIDGGPTLLIEADVDSLRFELSQYTGRIHLFTCMPGTDPRPKPLGVNIRPEELELLNCTASDDSKRRVFPLDISVCKRAMEFINEWNKLRPIEQRKLLGKPLQLPLNVELCFLKESTNHSTDGVLKGKSKRRNTPLDEISLPLPLNALWKTVELCAGSRKKKKGYTQGWTLTDEPLCKLCQTPCKGNNAKMPEFFEDLFCNLSCYEEYRIRISNRSLRQELFRVEHGVCSNCHLDCHKLVKHIKCLTSTMRQKYIEKVAPNIASRKKLIKKLVNDPIEGNAWHADHIVPVYLGGGECGLENMRTLCVACHYDVTAAQRIGRCSTRFKAKKLLKAIMTDLKTTGQNTERNNTYIEDQAHSSVQDNVSEDELLVKVPGSAYSGGKDSNAAKKEDPEEPSNTKETPVVCR